MNTLSLLPAPPCVIADALGRKPATIDVRRVLIATSDTLWAGALRRICGMVFWGCQLRVHRTAAGALQSLAAEEADLVITGLAFPDRDGLTVLERLRVRTRLLLVVSDRKDDWALMMLRTARFDGFFDPQEDDGAVLPEVLSRLAAGEAYISLSVKRRILAPRLDSALSERLTEAELKVFRQIADGSSNVEAAAELGMSEQTLKTHRRNIMGKLGVASSAKLVCEAMRLGILRDEPAPRVA